MYRILTNALHRSCSFACAYYNYNSYIFFLSVREKNFYLEKYKKNPIYTLYNGIFNSYSMNSSRI